MKTKLVTLTAIAAVLLASQASAINLQYSDYRDADYVGSDVGPKVGKKLTNAIDAVDQKDRSYAEGVFDIVSDDGDIYTWDKWGFTPGQEIITGAEVAFGFYNYTGSTPKYLGDVSFSLGSGMLSGTQGASSNSLFESLIVTPYQGSIIGSLLLDLQEDGFLSWRVELDDDFDGEVNLYWVALAADAERVPDSGSTAALLGFSIFAGLVLRRRQRI